jgi:arsenite-transporting ATPase
MVVKEAQRAYTYLNLYGYSVDAVVCNRVFPRDLEDPYFDVWKKAQAANLELVHECFHPLPVFEIPLFDQEVTGVPMLRRMADTVFGADPVKGGQGDPTGKYYVGNPQEIFRRNGEYVLSIPLPLAEREAVNLHRSVFDELIVRIGNWKRNLVLPTGLAKLDVSGAKYEGDRLNILFAIPPGEVIAPEELKPKRWDTLKSRLRGK